VLRTSIHSLLTPPNKERKWQSDPILHSESHRCKITDQAIRAKTLMRRKFFTPPEAVLKWANAKLSNPERVSNSDGA
jgi:hypothetical protein